MTARKTKPKPKPRKASSARIDYATDRDRIVANFQTVERSLASHLEALTGFGARLDALESRDRLRDKSHDEPVSNASEAIGHLTVAELPRPWWRRFLGFMGAP